MYCDLRSKQYLWSEVIHNNIDIIWCVCGILVLVVLKVKENKDVVLSLTWRYGHSMILLC